MKAQSAEREKLASMQYEFISLLFKDEGEFDAHSGGELRATALMLKNKRKRCIERSYPCLVESLAGSFDEIYAAYVKLYPSSHEGGAFFEARRFKFFVESKRPLPLNRVLSLLHNIFRFCGRISCVRSIKT